MIPCARFGKDHCFGSLILGTIIVCVHVSVHITSKCFPYLCVEMVFWISVLNIGVWASNVWRLRLGQMWLNYDIITHQIDFIQYARKLWMVGDKLNIYSAIQNWLYWMLHSNLSAVHAAMYQPVECLKVFAYLFWDGQWSSSSILVAMSSLACSGYKVHIQHTSIIVATTKFSQ